jgi:hypothetical protein
MDRDKKNRTEIETLAIATPLKVFTGQVEKKKEKEGVV